MPIKSLSQSSLTNFQKYSSMLAGNAAFSPSAYHLLETQVLSSSASSVTFTGLGSYTDYKHLQIRMTARNDITANTISTVLTFNGDTGSNYAHHKLEGDGSSVSSDAGTSRSNIDLEVTPAANAASNIFDAKVIDILDFASTNKNTTVRALNGLVDSSISRTRIYLLSGVYLSTNAITSITLDQAIASGNFVAGSRFSLYGVK